MTKSKGVFTSDRQIYTIIQDLFQQLRAHPEQVDPFTRSNLVVRLRLSDPQAEVLLDGRQPPLEVFFGPRPGRADLELAMPADLLHRIWMGEERLRDALFAGRIHTQGNALRAMHLVDLFRAAEQAYPQVAAAHGLISGDRH